LLLAIGGTALADKGKPPGKDNGKGKGREKVTLCHKGHTITVGKPAVPAHLRHGDTLGPCHAAVPGVAKLTVVKHVVNDNGGTKTAADFTMSVTGSSPSPSSFSGAESPGTSVNLNAGSYSVSESGPTTSYASSFSADCSGSIAVGQTKTCTVTNTHTKADTSTSTEQSLLPNDSATISGRDPVGGQAKFELFAPADDACSGDPALTETVDVVDGKASTSNTAFVASIPGTWRWKVSYLGDDENNASTSTCGVERFTITNN
jgi:hypothetical protein